MKIEVVRQIPFGELEKMFRRVPLTAYPDVFVYQDASIELIRVDPNEINPTSFYVTEKNLEFQRELRRQLQDGHGIDPFSLEGALEIRNEQGELWTLTPPIIEVATERVEYKPREGENEYDDTVEIKVPIINDGVHRVYLAREEGLPINIAHISGINPNYPFYAHANSWDQVEVIDEIPKQADKKYYLRGDNYALYRDFGPLGVGAPRKS